MRLIISKEDFTKAINEIENVMDTQSELNRVVREHDLACELILPDCTCTALNLLHIMLGIADDNEWLSHFVFELDFGRKYHPGDATDENGKDIDLSDADKLYDFLCTLD